MKELYQLSRREFLLTSLRVGAPLIIAGLTGVVQADEIMYQMQKFGARPSRYNATVFLAKQIYDESDKWRVGTGILLNRGAILTTAHRGIDWHFSYTVRDNI